MKILIMGAGAVGAYFGSILSREKKLISSGCKFIFPLPNLKIY